MRRLGVIGLGFLILFVALASADQDELTRRLPSEADLPGWTAEGPPRAFRGDELFDHLDGGAEIFMEFGFLRAAVQDYVGPGGRRLVLEIYDMEDDAAAYGLFTFYRKPGGEDLLLGDAAQLAEYYLTLWKGRTVVSITADGEGDDASPALRILAGAAEKKLGGGGRIPRLAARLPVEQQVPSGMDYFEGSIGFMNSVSFFSGDVFGVRRGVKGVYSGGYDVFLLQYEGHQESSAAYLKAGKSLERNEGFQEISGEGAGSYQLTKEDGRRAVVILEGAHIIGGVVHRPGPDAEEGLDSALEAARRAVRKKDGWRVGFSERLRYITSDNVRTLDQDEHQGQAAVYLRSRLSLAGPLAADWEFRFGLSNELRQMVAPSGRAFEWDEVILDTLSLRWAGPAGLPLALTLGRQRLFFGEGLLVAEGTPLDETRSDYFNAFRLDWTLAGRQAITFFVCRQTETDIWLPVLNGRRRPLVEQPETGMGLVWNRPGRRLGLEASVFFKTTSAGTRSLPESDILTLDGRMFFNLMPGMRFSGEAAFQFGNNGGQSLSSWGASARLNWDWGATLPLPLRAELGGFSLSGDDPDSGRWEGWVPLFSRWPRWSESYIYTLETENDGRTAWWSNLASVYGELDVDLTRRLSLHLAWHRLSAPRAAPGSWSRISGEGHVRGNLGMARLDFHFSERLAGHLLYEGFRPGSYYAAGAVGYSFLRFELTWSF